jgi:hypothetical protein
VRHNFLLLTFTISAVLLSFRVLRGAYISSNRLWTGFRSCVGVQVHNVQATWHRVASSRSSLLGMVRRDIYCSLNYHFHFEAPVQPLLIKAFSNPLQRPSGLGLPFRTKPLNVTTSLHATAPCFAKSTCAAILLARGTNFCSQTISSQNTPDL